MLHPPPLWRCVSRSERTLPCVGRGGRFRITSDAEVTQAPVTTETKDILWFEVAMDDSGLEVGQRIAHIGQDSDCFHQVQPKARRVDELPERHFCAGHDQYPRVAVFAMLNDRDHVSGVAEVNE